MEIDLGDVVATFGLRVKGMRSPRIRWKIGAPVKAAAADRVKRRQTVAPYEGKVDLVMDLMADNKVSAEIEFTDEMDNPVPMPDGASVTYTGDNPDVLSVQDNGDGTVTYTAMGPLGTANVHAEVNLDGKTLTGDAQVNVVAGLAERVRIVFGTPEEATPDA